MYSVPDYTRAISWAVVSAVALVVVDKLLTLGLGIDGKLFIGTLLILSIFILAPIEYCQKDILYGILVSLIWGAYINIAYEGFVPLFERALAVYSALAIWVGYGWMYSD